MQKNELENVPGRHLNLKNREERKFHIVWNDCPNRSRNKKDLNGLLKDSC